MDNQKLEKYINYLVDWIKTEVKSRGAKGVVFGLSGGIDSSVVAMLAKKAFPNNHLGLIMPVKSNNLDYNYALELVKLMTINYKIVKLNHLHKDFNKNFKIKELKLKQLVLGNASARLRMTMLYAHAQLNQYLVLGTDNACEWYLGYFTKFGDGGVDLLPIVNLLKREVKLVGKILKVPDFIINRQPTASLWEGQNDEEELTFSYDVIDDFLSGKKVNSKDLARIKYLHNVSEHKRLSISQPKKITEFL